MTPSNKQSVDQVSRNPGIPIPTLYKWKKLFSNIGSAILKNSTPANRWGAKAKLEMIIIVLAMNEIQRSKYCCQYGIFPKQIKQ